MKTRFLNPPETLIEVTIEPGEALGPFACPAGASAPLVVPILTSPASPEGDALLALIADGKAPAPAPWGLPGAEPILADPNAVPDITPAQAKIMLRRVGLLDQVKAIVAEIGGEVEIWFDEAGTWQRSNPNVAALGSQVSLDGTNPLTPAEIDDLFREAKKIIV